MGALGGAQGAAGQDDPVAAIMKAIETGDPKQIVEALAKAVPLLAQAGEQGQQQLQQIVQAIDAKLGPGTGMQLVQQAQQLAQQQQQQQPPQ